MLLQEVVNCHRCIIQCSGSLMCLRYHECLDHFAGAGVDKTRVERCITTSGGFEGDENTMLSKELEQKVRR